MKRDREDRNRNLLKLSKKLKVYVINISLALPVLRKSEILRRPNLADLARRGAAPRALLKTSQ